MLTFKDNYFGESDKQRMFDAAYIVRGFFPEHARIYGKTLMDLFCEFGTTIEGAADLCKDFLYALGRDYPETISADDFKAFTELEFVEIIAPEDEGPDWETRCEDRYGYNCY